MIILDGTEYTCPPDKDWGEWATGLLAKDAQWRHAELIGEHPTTHGLGLVGLRKGHTVDARKLKLGVTDAPVALDLIDSAGIRWEGGHIEGAGCGVGLLESRCAEEQSRSAGSHLFQGLTIVGSYVHAAHVNIGAESSRHLAATLQNESGRALLLTRDNSYGITSRHRQPFNDRTATNAEFHALQATSKGDDLTTPAAVHVEGFDRVHFSGQFYIASDCTGLLLDCSRHSMAGLRVPDLVWYVKKRVPRVPLRIRGQKRQGLVSLWLFASHLHGGSDGAAFSVDLVDGEPGFTMTNCHVEHHEALMEDWGGTGTPEGSPVKFEGTCEMINRQRRVTLP